MLVSLVTFAIDHLVHTTTGVFQACIPAFRYGLGYRPTFGLIAVDRQTQGRTVKPSARWLGQVARAHGF